MVEGENGVVEGQSEARLAGVEIARFGQLFQMVGEFVADEADRAALEWRQVGVGIAGETGKHRVESGERRALKAFCVERCAGRIDGKGREGRGRDEGIPPERFVPHGAVEEGEPAERPQARCGDIARQRFDLFVDRHHAARLPLVRPFEVTRAFRRPPMPQAEPRRQTASRRARRSVPNTAA